MTPSVAEHAVTARSTRLQRARRRTFEVLEVAESEDQLSRFVDVFIATLIALNIVAVVLESVASVEQVYRDLFAAFEQISVVTFSVEFLLRVWAVAENPKLEGSAWQRRAKYLRSFMAVIDIAAIAPYYLLAFFSLDLRFMRILRLLRVFKLTRYSASLTRIAEVIRLQRRGLGMSVVLMALAIICAASIIYVVERPAQPVAFASIPKAMWWAVCTLTTVGYGDVTPITPLGKLLASFITLIGVGMVALPTSLLASGFSELATRDREKLEAEARRAFADGVLSPNERDAYELLAQRLDVAPELAHEIILRAQEGDFGDEGLVCRHCRKALATT